MMLALVAGCSTAAPSPPPRWTHSDGIGLEDRPAPGEVTVVATCLAVRASGLDVPRIVRLDPGWIERHRASLADARVISPSGGPVRMPLGESAWFRFDSLAVPFCLSWWPAPPFATAIPVELRS